MHSLSIGELDLAVGGDGGLTRDDLVLIARVADEVGMRNLFVTEGVGRDVFSILNEMALKTEHISLGTGIVNIFSRTPTALAQCVASVMELMGDRCFNLGLGTSGRLLMEKYHGVRFERPVSRLAETVRILDETFQTGCLPSGGEMFPLGGLRLGVPVSRDRLRIYIAGLSDRTLSVTSRLADGWLPIWPSLSRFSRVADALAETSDAVGRPRPIVSGYIYGGVGGRAVREYVKSTMAWYVAANGTAYRRLFERYGYSVEAATICELWSEGDHEAARSSVPEWLVDDTSLVGDAADVLERAGRFVDVGVDRPVLRLLGQLGVNRCVRTLVELAEASR